MNVYKTGITKLRCVLPLCMALTLASGSAGYAGTVNQQEVMVTEQTESFSVPVTASGNELNSAVSVRYLVHPSDKSLDVYTDSESGVHSLALLGYFSPEDLAADPLALLYTLNYNESLMSLWMPQILSGAYDTVTVHSPGIEAPTFYLPEWKDAYTAVRNTDGLVETVEETWGSSGRTLKVSRDENGRIRLVRRTSGSMNEGDPTQLYLMYDDSGRISACVFPGFLGYTLAAETIAYDENGRLAKMTGVQAQTGEGFSLTIVWTMEGFPAEVLLTEGDESVSLTLYYANGRITMAQQKRYNTEAVLYEQSMQFSYQPLYDEEPTGESEAMPVTLSLGTNFLDVDQDGETDCLKIVKRDGYEMGMLSVVYNDTYDIEVIDGSTVIENCWLIQEGGRTLLYVSCQPSEDDDAAYAEVFDLTEGITYLERRMPGR